MEKTSERHPVKIGWANNSTLGTAIVHTWSEKERFKRAVFMSAKIVGILAGIALPFAFMEPFMFMVWGSAYFAFLILIAGPGLYLYFLDEAQTFLYVEGACPDCQAAAKQDQPQRLEPYLHRTFKDHFKVICRACGQTFEVSRLDPESHTRN